MIENSLEGFIAVRDILLLAPAEEIVTMFNTEELQDYLLENINLLLNFDSRCLFLKKDIDEKLLLIVNNGRFKTENVNRLTKINYAIIKINTEKCHNNSIEEMNSYILQQCKLRLGKRLTLEYMYDYKLLKETLLELMEYDADLINSLKNRSLFINENNIFKIRNNFACKSIGISPISSRKIVPRSDASKRPCLSFAAPVNAPALNPNISLSSSSLLKAEQLIAKNGCLPRLLFWWMD
jgi:hypothetical protein